MEIQKQYEGTQTFTFDFNNKTSWKEYEAFCKEIESSANGEGHQGPSSISILVNGVERYDAGKGKIHKQTDEELVETTNANTFP